MTDRPIDPEVLAAKQAQIAGYGIGARVAAMIYVGIELGLYAALRVDLTHPVNAYYEARV